jgi:hypothetical protein
MFGFPSKVIGSADEIGTVCHCLSSSSQFEEQISL